MRVVQARSKRPSRRWWSDVCRISNGSAVLLVEYGASGPYSGAAV
jgi:hypothetical protein